MRKYENTLHVSSLNVPVYRYVENQAAACPSALAISSKDGDLTYGELNERADQLSDRLRMMGVGPDVPVALFIKSSPELVIGALGIMKSGGAYLPLDPDCPRSRISFILNDAKVPVVVTGRQEVHAIPEGNWNVVDIDLPLPSTKLRSTLLSGQESDLTDLAYVIYTSGSTGQPKGVEITHASLLNLVTWHCSEFSITPADRATQIAGVGFDAAVWELWPYLATGASLLIPDELTRTEPELLRNWMLRGGITVCFLPTLMAERIMALDWPADTSLRFVLTGADTLNRYPSPGLPFTLVNNYGPTECTVVTTSGVVPPIADPVRKPSIGRPILNARVYILDDELRQVPNGLPGQLYIGGAGVARGYVNRPELTASRFPSDPFSPEPGARMYATGDRAALLDDGWIDFLGRLDDQIKIRGFRIEPDEIVSILDRIPEILEAAVVVRGDQPDEQRLVAYVVIDPDRPVTCGAIHEFLSEHLPEYMVPAVFVVMDRLPLTQNGKVDRAALPEPSEENTMRADSIGRPEYPVETRLKDILIPLLKVNDLGVHSNFFQMGGHSLLGAQVLVRIRESFGVELSLKAIFDHPTVGGISAEIERRILEKLDAIDKSQGA